jgi:hypothetical protein
MSGTAPSISTSGAGTIADNHVQEEGGRIYGTTTTVEVSPSRVRFADPADSAYRLQILPATGEMNWADGTTLHGRLLREANGQVVFRQDVAGQTRFTVANYTTGVSGAANIRVSSGLTSSANYNYAEIYATDSGYTTGGTRFNGRLVFAPAKVGSNTDNGVAFYLATVGSTLDYYIGGLTRSGRWESDGSLSVEAGFNTTPATLQTLTADDQSVTATSKSLVRITSDSATATARTFTIGAGRSGQTLILFWTGTGVSGELLSTGNVSLTGTWTPDSVGDNLHLIYDSATSEWYETSRVNIP